MNTRKHQQIESALARIRVFQRDPVYADKQYAIQQNIIFLEAVQSLPRYLRWLFTVAPKLDGSQLLELTDFPVPEWDIVMHERLIAMQRRKRPGLITPLVTAITDYIKNEDRDLILADLGAGGMEVDRQVISWAINQKLSHRLTIVAVDKSPTTRRIAYANLQNIAREAEVIETGEITADDLNRLQAGAKKNVLVVMCTNDIFDMSNKFPSKCLDLVYHSLFRHHLDQVEQGKLENTIQTISKRHFEFDGYKSWPHGFIQSLFAWTSPVFLNGTIISMARYRTRNEISRESGGISYYANTSHYLRKLQS